MQEHMNYSKHRAGYNGVIFQLLPSRTVFLKYLHELQICLFRRLTKHWRQLGKVDTTRTKSDRRRNVKYENRWTIVEVSDI